MEKKSIFLTHQKGDEIVSHILLLGSQMETGGAQRVLLDQADWFSCKGWKVTVAFLYDKEGLHDQWQKSKRYPIINLFARRPGASSLENALRLLRSCFRLFLLLKQSRVDVIETFTHHANLIGLPIAWLLKVPVRVGSHHGKILGFSRKLERFHAWVANRTATSIVAVSQVVKLTSIKEGLDDKKLVVIPNGVTIPIISKEDCQDIRTAVGIGSNIPFILNIGRMTYQKAQTYFLKAAFEVLHKFPDAVFAIAGDGPLRTELEDEVRALGIEDHLIFLGIRKDISHLAASADVFILTSRWEGLPIALLEAMSVGTASIATSVEGVTEVIHPGENGLLIPSEDPVSASQAIITLLTDSRLRYRLGEEGRKTVVSSYSIDRMCSKYLLLFEKNSDSQMLSYSLPKA